MQLGRSNFSSVSLDGEIYVMGGYDGKYFRKSWPEVIKLFSCSTQLSTKFILLINIKMPTRVGLLTFISMINTHLRDLKHETSLFVCNLCFMSR